MIKKIGFKAEITSNPQLISKGTKFILPGVGSFEYGIKKLKSMSYFSILESKILTEKVPILGVCLGAQFKFTEKDLELKIPHMGWNFVRPLKKSMLLNDLNPTSRFYFVHGYHFNCEEEKTKLLETEYGYPFISAVEKENILGVQFHPEKSHKFGMILYKNFLNNY